MFPFPTPGLNLNENELVSGGNIMQQQPKGQTPYTITVNVIRGNQGKKIMNCLLIIIIVLLV